MAKEKLYFFKLAMREDGSVDGGYITTKDSLTLVHEIRTKLDLLVIGGETVRVDRPTLDTRFARKYKAPNILIYSTQKEFDTTIPLFSIENRDVVIDDNLVQIDTCNFTMIEGGKNLLEVLKDKLDCLMLFISHKEKKQHQFNLDTLGFTKIHSYFINTHDEVIFLK